MIHNKTARIGKLQRIVNFAAAYVAIRISSRNDCAVLVADGRTAPHGILLCDRASVLRH